MDEQEPKKVMRVWGRGRARKIRQLLADGASSREVIELLGCTRKDINNIRHQNNRLDRGLSAHATTEYHRARYEKIKADRKKFAEFRRRNARSAAQWRLKQKVLAQAKNNGGSNETGT